MFVQAGEVNEGNGGQQDTVRDPRTKAFNELQQAGFNAYLARINTVLFIHHFGGGGEVFNSTDSCLASLVVGLSIPLSCKPVIIVTALSAI